jgi:hypothetical protein
MTERKSPLEINSIENPVLKQAYKYFCRHLVCLACRCDPIDSAGQVNGKPEFVALSGLVLSVRGEWYLLTAGHIFEDVIEKHFETSRWKKMFVLACDFGPEAVHHEAIPFDYKKPDIVKNKSGVDFGIVALPPEHRALLEKNNVVPIGEANWVNQHKVEYEHHLMLGFPVKLTEVEITESPDGYDLVGTIGTAMLYVTKLESSPDRFVGQIGDGGLSDINGLSGCPIFGIEKGKRDEYWIVAIQNAWWSGSRTVFGTPIAVLGKMIEEEIQAAPHAETA